MSLQTLTFDAAGLTVRWASTSFPLPGINTTGVGAILAGNLSNDGVDDIVVQRADNSYVWYDLLPGGEAPVEKELSLVVAVPAMLGITAVVELFGIADANGDGRNEVLYTSYLSRTGVELPPVRLAAVTADTTVTSPIPPQPSDIWIGNLDFDMSNIRVDLRGIPLNTNGEIYIDHRGPVAERPAPETGSIDQPKVINAIDLETGELYVVWANYDADQVFIGMGDLDGRGGIDVLFKDRVSGELFVKNDSSEKHSIGAFESDTSQIVAVGNFGAGAGDELLFFNAVSREFVAWVHAPFGETPTDMIYLDYYQHLFKIDQGWEYVGAHDIDGDGFNDIVIANVGDFAPNLPGSAVPMAYFSSAQQTLVTLGNFAPETLVGAGHFFDGPVTV